jgi:pimeloyl-ACP methyl ester carboxylesterase
MSTVSSLLAPGEHKVSLNDLSIHYTVQGSGPVLLFVSPGWGINRSLYATTHQPLEEHFTVIYLSPRGCDGSERPASASLMLSRYTASDIEEFRKQLGIEQLDVAGHSDGGVLALAYAIYYPSHVRRLIAICTNLLGYQRKDISFWVEFNRIYEAMDPQDDDAFKQFMLDAFHLYFYKPELHVPKLKDMWTGKPSIWARGTRHGSEREDGWIMEKELGKIEAKTLVLAAKQDRCCAPEVSEVVASGVTDSTLVLLDECGHLPWLEAREEYFDVLVKFLKE